MGTELARLISELKIHDTHEHMFKEDPWLQERPDILNELFNNYALADLKTAGASDEALKRLLDAANPEIAARFEGIRKAWEATRFTGYGEAVRIAARRFFQLEELDGPALAAAQERLPRQWAPGDRLRVLRDEGGLDHIQTDDFIWTCLPDASGPGFFFYDLSWWSFSRGQLRNGCHPKGRLAAGAEPLFLETGVTVRGLETLREAMAGLFHKYGPCAIAVKSQHAYQRSLAWRYRSDAEVAPLLERILSDGGDLALAEADVFGDWCLARGVELAGEHGLPVKIHCGHYAGTGSMRTEYISAGHLCGLLKRYPKTRFVLMHLAWPYDDELVSIAKQYPNVWVDCCWAWSMNPQAGMAFVRRFLHAVPSNKLFGFGGDTRRPRIAVAYALQARKWLTKALEAEVREGEWTEPQAQELARRILQGNQAEVFDLERKRRTIRGLLEAGQPAPAGR